jgi:hypothetical protein
VLLTLAGNFLHFDHHSDHSVAAGMRKRLEKRWKALDQPMFIFALILNPYECLDHFGDKAGVNVFSLNTLLMNVRGVVACFDTKYSNLIASYIDASNLGHLP